MLYIHQHKAQLHRQERHGCKWQKCAQRCNCQSHPRQQPIGGLHRLDTHITYKGTINEIHAACRRVCIYVTIVTSSVIGKEGIVECAACNLIVCQIHEDCTSISPVAIVYKPVVLKITAPASHVDRPTLSPRKVVREVGSCD